MSLFDKIRKRVKHIEPDPDKQVVYLKEDLKFFATKKSDVNADKKYCFAGIVNGSHTKIKDVITGEIYDSSRVAGYEGDNLLKIDITVLRGAKGYRHDNDCKISGYGTCLVDGMIIGEKWWSRKLEDFVVQPFGEIGYYFFGDSKEINLAEVKRILNKLNDYAHKEAIRLSKENVKAKEIKSQYDANF